jgi:hypothetical protein
MFFHRKIFVARKVNPFKPTGVNFQRKHTRQLVFERNFSPSLHWKHCKDLLYFILLNIKIYYRDVRHLFCLLKNCYVPFVRVGVFNCFVTYTLCFHSDKKQLFYLNENETFINCFIMKSCSFSPIWKQNHLNVTKFLSNKLNIYKCVNHHQLINIPTTGAQAFIMNYI